MDQNPSTELYDRMAERFLSAPDTHVGPALISVPGARALFLDEGCPCSQDAFRRGREFAHIHPAFDGSFHMMLSPSDCQEVLAKRWGELHPFAKIGKAPPTTTMVYAPGNDEEIDVILQISEASRHFAMTPASDS